MSNALKKITAQAKIIYKRGGTWRGAIKKAAAAFRAGYSRPGDKRRTRPKTKKSRAKRKKAVTRTVRRGSVVKVHHILAGVGATRSAYKNSLREKIMNAAGRRELAIKVRQRKKISKEIAKLKRDYRALC
jgi:hypothetical protein